MEETQGKISYSKLKQLDKMAKSIGVTIYNITYGTDIDNQKQIWEWHEFNKIPSKN